MQNLKVELQVGSGYYGVRCENVHVIIMPKAPNIVTFVTVTHPQATALSRLVVPVTRLKWPHSSVSRAAPSQQLLTIIMPPAALGN